MIHINLTPNTEEGWADKVLKTNLWPINLDTWAALKASENEIFSLLKMMLNLIQKANSMIFLQN